MIGEFFSNMSLFEKIYDVAILVWAVMIFIGIHSVCKNLKGIVEKTNKAHKSTRGETSIDSEGNLDQPTSNKINKRKHDDIRDDYVKQAVKYTKWANLISTLPLAGLLGTVLGLIPGLIAVKAQNFDALYSALSTALSSTVIGLITTLILKVYVSVRPEAQLNEVDLLFDEIDRMYEEAIALKNIKK